MIISIERALRSERLLRATIGMSKKAFDELLKAFAVAFKEYEMERIAQKKDRKRAPGAGGKPILNTLEQRLFFLLFYLKAYPTCDLAGLFFNAHRSQPCRWFNDWLPVLEKALGHKAVLPKRQMSSVKEFLDAFPGIKNIFIRPLRKLSLLSSGCVKNFIRVLMYHLYTAALHKFFPYQRNKIQSFRRGLLMEQNVRFREEKKSSDKENKSSDQDKDYSGKKKRHTKKNLIATDEVGRVLYLGKTEPGSVHDFTLFKESDLPETIPKEVSVWVDSAFQGIFDKCPEHDIYLPHKKKDGFLCSAKREMNKIMASVRVRVEHAIGHVKRLKCLTDVYRNRKANMENQMMHIGCGLWNLVLATR